MNNIFTFDDFLYEKLDKDMIEEIVKRHIKNYDYEVKKTEDGIIVDMRIDSYSSDYDKISNDIKTELLDNFDKDIAEIYSEWESHFTVYLTKESLILEKKRKKKNRGKIETGLPKPNGLKVKMKGVGLGKDKDGYFVYTHRARCDSYDTPEKIPDYKIKFIESTG